MLKGKKTIYLKNCLLVLLCMCAITLRAQYSDTIYYNRSWQITEKPFAAFYRVGYVGYGNPYIIYTGKVTDHFADGTMEMEGNYSIDGIKTGHFKYYYTSGKILSEGNYTKGLFDGDWTFYHKNGTKVGLVHYNISDSTFTVKEAYDSTGRPKLQNGTGDFDFLFYDIRKERYYRVIGEMSKGKRSGNWEYHVLYDGKIIKQFTEKYSDGKIKKTTYYSLTGIQMKSVPEDLHIVRTGDYEKFRMVDSFRADLSVFNYLEENTSLKNAVQSFLFDKTPVLINAAGDIAHQSFNVILSKLNTPWLLRNFNDSYKDYMMSFSFHISDSGTLHDFTTKGNLSVRESEMALAILKKFRNVKPIMIENVEVDALHTIYFYGIHVAEILPKRLQEGADTRILVFTMIPREKLVAKLKKDVKIQLKTNEQFTNFINSNLRWQLRD